MQMMCVMWRNLFDEMPFYVLFWVVFLLIVEVSFRYKGDSGCSNSSDIRGNTNQMYIIYPYNVVQLLI